MINVIAFLNSHIPQFPHSSVQVLHAPPPASDDEHKTRGGEAKTKTNYKFKRTGGLKYGQTMFLLAVENLLQKIKQEWMKVMMVSWKEGMQVSHAVVQLPPCGPASVGRWRLYRAALSFPPRNTSHSSTVQKKGCRRGVRVGIYLSLIHI